MKDKVRIKKCLDQQLKQVHHKAQNNRKKWARAWPDIMLNKRGRRILKTRQKHINFQEKKGKEDTKSNVKVTSLGFRKCKAGKEE